MCKPFLRIAKAFSAAFLLLVSFAIVAPVPTNAWSVDGHQLMTRYAIAWLPLPWRQFFSYYNWFLTDAVAYPDTYYRGTDPKEGPRHYVDLEVWNPNDASTGTLPQAVNEFAHKMQLAVEAKDWNSVFLLAGRVGHYVEDVAQPYHTTINYNPLNRAGVGLHAVLDSSLIAHSSEIKILTPSNAGEITPIGNLTDFVLSMARQSHSFLPIINQTLINQGLNWSPELTRIVENRTNTAIAAVARVWYTAIVEAKSQPPMPPAQNQLSIIVEGISSMDNGLVSIRLRVVDSLGVPTYADVTLTTVSSTFRGQVANVFPPAGEYVVVSETGLHPTDSLTAQRQGYITGILAIGGASVTSSGQRSSVTGSLDRRVPTVTIVALAVMLTGILVLVVLESYRKVSRDS